MSSAAARARLDAAAWSGLLRPRIGFLVVLSAAAAFLLERPASLAALPWLCLGTLLVSAAGCALNHYLERDTDARMERTARRPLVTGALRPGQVLAGGLVALALGLLVLLLGCNALTALVEAGAAAIYLGIYTPLKRRTSTNTWVGAVPGALPVLAGAAAASGAPSRLSLIVFGLIFVWQLPHFFAIASMYREQYRSGGLRMLSGDDPKDALLRWQLPMLVMTVMLVSTLPVLVGPARTLYAGTALLLGGVFLWAAFGFRRRPDRPGARRVVLASVVYLPLVLAALVVDVSCIQRPSGAANSSAGDDAGAASPITAGGLPSLGRLPEFSLVRQDGTTFTRDDLAGDPWIVDFIFTSCAGACVPMTQTMTKLQAEGLPARFLSISVDPARDSPQALTDYRTKWQGDPERWTLLTGSDAAIGTLGRDGFKLSIGTGAAPVEGMPSLFHSEKYALVDGAGWVRGYYDSNDSLELARLRQDVARLQSKGGGGGEASGAVGAGGR
jgi:protoheme IX farnesyltransferase